MSYTMPEQIIEDGIRQGLRAALDAAKITALKITTALLPIERAEDVDKQFALPCIFVAAGLWVPQGYQAPNGTCPLLVRVFTDSNSDDGSQHAALLSIVRAAFDQQAKSANDQNTAPAFTFASGVSLRGFLWMGGQPDYTPRGQQTDINVDLKITVAL